MNSRRHVFLVITLELFQELATKNKYYNKRCSYIFLSYLGHFKGFQELLPGAGDKDQKNDKSHSLLQNHKDIILYFYSYCMFIKITFIVY